MQLHQPLSSIGNIVACARNSVGRNPPVAHGLHLLMCVAMPHNA